MTIAAFDTLKFARTLRDKAHFSQEQAEGFADAMAVAFEGDVATKGDIQAVRAEAGLSAQTLQTGIADLGKSLRAEIAELAVTLRAEISQVKTELRGEIAALGTELRGEIAKSNAELRAQIADSKAELIKWMFGAIGFQTIILIGGVLALLKVVRP